MDNISTEDRVGLDRLNDVYARRYGPDIDLVKKEVGEGDIYINSVATALLSKNGVWCECKDLPSEFTGTAGGDYVTRFITTEEALELLNDFYHASMSDVAKYFTHYDLFVLYEPEGITNPMGAFSIYYQFTPNGPYYRPREKGKFRKDTMPLYFRCRTKAQVGQTVLGSKDSVKFFLKKPGDVHLFVEIPYDDPTVIDLSNNPIGSPQQ